jgi:hypothetical protein
VEVDGADEGAGDGAGAGAVEVEQAAMARSRMAASLFISYPGRRTERAAVAGRKCAESQVGYVGACHEWRGAYQLVR